MSLSECLNCGGHIPLGPNASNRCEKCGRHFWDGTPAPAQVAPGGVITEERVERLAAIEHEQWMTWASTVAEREPISDERRARWMSCMVPYSQLSEEMKEHDRVWARKVIAALSPDAKVVEGWVGDGSTLYLLMVESVDQMGGTNSARDVYATRELAEAAKDMAEKRERERQSRRIAQKRDGTVCSYWIEEITLTAKPPTTPSTSEGEEQ